MLKTRYKFLKKLYPWDVILFYKDGKYLLYDNDYYVLRVISYYNIVNELENNHINYLIINNLRVIKHNIYCDNKYYEYLFKGLLIECFTCGFISSKS